MQVQQILTISYGLSQSLANNGPMGFFGSSPLSAANPRDQGAKEQGINKRKSKELGACLVHPELQHVRSCICYIVLWGIYIPTRVFTGLHHTKLFF